MSLTISTHNGTAAHRDHNIRSAHVVRNQTHIRKDGEWETWHDETLKVAYHRLFDEPVDEFNQRARKDRRIYDYLDYVRKDGKKNPVYEMIVGVYQDRPKAEETVLTDDLCKEILREFYEGWKERNPSLELIGAYYHADEQGKQPHLHIDYIPVGHNCSRGLRTQNSLSKALEEIGFSRSSSERGTPQIRWEKRENQALEELCRSRGFEVEHPMSDGMSRKHLDTPEYKTLKRELHSLETKVLMKKQSAKLHQKDLEEAKSEVFKWDEKLKEVRETLEKTADKLTRNKKALSEAQEAYKRIEGDVDHLREQKSSLTGEIGDLREQADKLHGDIENANKSLSEAQEAYNRLEGDIKPLRDEKSRLEGLMDEFRKIVAEYADRDEVKFYDLQQSLLVLSENEEDKVWDEYEKRVTRRLSDGRSNQRSSDDDLDL